MNLSSITCPKCQKKFSPDLILKSRLEEEQKRIEKSFESERKAIAVEKKKLQITTAKVVARRLDQERRQLTTKIRAEVENKVKLELRDLHAQLSEQDAKAGEALEAELTLRKEKRDLEDKVKNFNAEVERQVDAAREVLSEEIWLTASEGVQKKILEKDKQLDDLKRTVNELKRKVEQGPSQLQGESWELHHEQILREACPQDTIEAVKSGTRGADVIQTVHTASGLEAGKIIWEFKNTRTWSDGWISKLKDDQRQIAADLGAIVTSVLPKGSSGISRVDDVWIVDSRNVEGLACALREQLLQVAHVRIANIGKSEKKELLHGYVNGVQFRQRVEAMVDAVVSQRDDLEREKRFFFKSWAGREQQIKQVVANVAGMYGDIQGIVGRAQLNVPVLEVETSGKQKGT